MPSPRQLLHVAITAAKAWADDGASSMGAAIAYYTVFSVAPLLVIVIAVAGALFGRDAVEGAVAQQLARLMGEQAAQTVQALVAAASDTGRGLVAGLLSAGALVLGATTVFAELQSALDRIWKVPEHARPSGLWGVLQARILSFGLVLGVAFLLMVSLVVSTVLAALGRWFGGLLPGWNVLAYLLNIAVSLGVQTALFALIFRFMPTTRIAWHDVRSGALVTSVLFETGKWGISLYLGTSGMDQVFHAAGSVVVLLAWVYYAAQIFLLGAEFTRAWAQSHGSLRDAAKVPPPAPPAPAAPAR